MNHLSSHPAIIRTLGDFGSATIYEAQGAHGALDSGIKPIHPDMRIAGPAFTVDAWPADNLMLHCALLKAQPGDVLVVDAKGFVEAGAWGDVLTEQAVKQGIAGLVINGAVRDANAIVKMGFPVFSRGLSIKGTSKNRPGRLNVPVCFGDVQINPGDIIVGDQDGIVVVPKEGLQFALENSQAREEKEAMFRERIRKGATTVELLDLGETVQRLNLV